MEYLNSLTVQSYSWENYEVTSESHQDTLSLNVLSQAKLELYKHQENYV